MSIQTVSHGILCRRMLSRVLYAPFHASAAPASSKRKSIGPSRTRLAKDPSKPTPKKPEFTRDTAPHTSVDSVDQASTGHGAFRRHRNPGRAPRYTWGEEITSSSPSPAPKKRAQNHDTPSTKTAGLSRGGHVDREKQQLAAKASKSYKPPSPSPASSKDSFRSPPLLPGLLECLQDVIGEKAKPTAIQAMSIEHFLNNPSEEAYKQCLLASETGSGKSIAYLLPLLQSLKGTEPSASTERERDMNPRALVLAPTHELSRQLSGFAKALLHNVKLRVVCASRANAATRNSQEVVWSTQKPQAATHDVDVLVGTPMKLMEMTRGRGWDRIGEAQEHLDAEQADEAELKNFRRGRDLQLGGGEPTRARAEPEVGLGRVEWVIVDEADVLFDPDFQESTRLLLSDIARAKSGGSAELLPQNYPFNLVLTTATIPSALQTYLSTNHPNMTRLTSPNIHRLPSTLKTKYVSWSGGNKNADIERQIRQVWQDEFYSKKPATSKSKILIFCNKSDKAEDLGRHLTESGIENVTLTRTNDTRRYGSNHHLDGFLKTQSTRPLRASLPPAESNSNPDQSESSGEPPKDPKVLITTSLLSRGLDFAPSIRNVFIVDEPRNMVDFLHRAGRSGRAGEQGNVVVFGKMEGRGSERSKDVRKKIAEVSAPGSQRLKMRA